MSDLVGTQIVGFLTRRLIHVCISENADGTSSFMFDERNGKLRLICVISWRSNGHCVFYEVESWSGVLDWSHGVEYWSGTLE